MPPVANYLICLSSWTMCVHMDRNCYFAWVKNKVNYSVVPFLVFNTNLFYSRILIKHRHSPTLASVALSP